MNQIIPCFILSPCRFYGLDYWMQITMKKMGFNVLPIGVNKCLDIGAFHFRVLSGSLLKLKHFSPFQFFFFNRVQAQSKILGSHWKAWWSIDQCLSLILSTCLHTLLLFHVETATCSSVCWSLWTASQSSRNKHQMSSIYSNGFTSWWTHGTDRFNLLQCNTKMNFRILDAFLRL